MVEGFAQFTKSALRIGNAVLVIATESLRNGILQRLAKDGVDLHAAAERERYLSMDVFDLASSSRIREAVSAAAREGLHVAVG